MKRTKFPPGWDENRVREVLAHYETLTEEEALAEDEAASEDSSQTLMEARPALKDGSKMERTLKRPRIGSALQRACSVSTGVYAGAEVVPPLKPWFIPT